MRTPTKTAEELIADLADSLDISDRRYESAERRSINPLGRGLSGQPHGLRTFTSAFIPKARFVLGPSFGL